MHDNQLSIDAGLARELIHDQYPQFRGEEVAYFPSVGTVNAIFRIGLRHAARFPLRMMAAAECFGLLEREAQAAREFRKYCPFPSPRWVGIGGPGPTYPMPWAVQTWIEGSTATPTGLSSSTTFALELARLITSIRAADVNGRTFDGRGRGGKLADHDDWMEVCFSNSEDLLDVRSLGRMWQDFRQLPPPAREVMSHKDLIPANLLVRGEQLIGVLDTGGFGPADSSLDLVAGWHLLDSDCRQAFREAMQADDLEWQRGAAWAFQQAMGLVWYYKDTNPTMSDLGRSTISRLQQAFKV